MRSTRPFASLAALSLATLAGCTLFRRDPVETPAVFLADSVLLGPGSAYPTSAAPRGADTVTVQFVVDTDGRPEVGTFKALRATDPMLIVEARAALEKWRYVPARMGKCPVRQLVQTNVARYQR